MRSLRDYCYLWLFITILLHTQFLLHLYLKTFLYLHISHRYRFESNKHTIKHKNTLIDEEKRIILLQSQRICVFRRGFFLKDNYIILCKSYSLLLLLLMLLSLLYSAGHYYRFEAYSLYNLDAVRSEERLGWSST